MTKKLKQYDHNKLQHGAWVDYYQDGTIWWEGHFIHGRIHGMQRYYTINGKLSSIYRYRYGDLFGLSVEYHSAIPKKIYWVNIK
jgi:antitoxin component YwqK of YwqJK toxin-antitoxin module